MNIFAMKKTNVHEFYDIDLYIKTLSDVKWVVRLVGPTQSINAFDVGDEISIGNIIGIDINENRKLLEDLFSSSWVDALGESFFSSTGFTYIGNYIAKLRETTTIYPDRKVIFKAFRLTPFNEVKVVILGQDCYHDGSADGLAFSNSKSNTISPSLKNILKEIEKNQI